MLAVIYVSKPLKKVNGSLFYAFEYYMFLKKCIPDIKFIIMGVDDRDLDFYKSIFLDKYIVTSADLENVVTFTRTGFLLSKVTAGLFVDVGSYVSMKDFLHKTKVFLYCNKPEGKEFLNKSPNHIQYGWYESYQFFNVKTRLKLYREIHRTYDASGFKTFISSPNEDNKVVAKHLNLSLDTVYLKEPNTHHYSFFKDINKIIYWHNGNNDANNRIVVESKIHRKELEVVYNGHTDDSVYDRHELIKGGLDNELYLTLDDQLIVDFVKEFENE